jgi:hypothetical protein
VPKTIHHSISQLLIVKKKIGCAPLPCTWSARKILGSLAGRSIAILPCPAAPVACAVPSDLSTVRRTAARFSQPPPSHFPEPSSTRREHRHLVAESASLPPLCHPPSAYQMLPATSATCSTKWFSGCFFPFPPILQLSENHDAALPGSIACFTWLASFQLNSMSHYIKLLCWFVRALHCWSILMSTNQ